MNLPEPAFEIVVPTYSGGVLYEKGTPVFASQFGAFWPDLVRLGAVKPLVVPVKGTEK